MKNNFKLTIKLTAMLALLIQMWNWHQTSGIYIS